MAKYLELEREGTFFVNGSLESLLPENSQARLIWTFLEGLDFEKHDKNYRNDDTGRPALDPRSLSGVWILGLLRGVDSSVALSRLCKTDVEFRWLLGEQEVEKSTLCWFRRENIEALGELSTQVLVALSRCGLVKGEEVGIDGTMLESVSSRSSVYSRKQLQEKVERLRVLIEEKLKQVDEEGSREKVMRRKALFEEALEEMDSLGLREGKSRININEKEASLKKMKDGRYRPGYNVQVASDLSSGAIISTEVTCAGNDRGQLDPQLEKARERLSEVSERLEAGGEQRLGEVKSVAADSQYYETNDLVSLDGDVETYVPEGFESWRPPGVSDRFLASQFIYNESTDTMICPESKSLRRRSLNRGKTAMRYEAAAKDCLACRYKGECCPKSKGGRTVSRLLYPEVLEATKERAKSGRGQKMKKARQVVMEGCMARLKGLLHWPRCRTWGKQGVAAELLWRQLTHNIMLLAGAWRPLALRVLA
jgi:transposase